MTEDKSSQPDESPFNLDALEKMDLKKNRGVRPPKPVNYHEARSIGKPGKKFDVLKQPNPWLKSAAIEDEKEPSVIKEPDSLDASPEEESSVKEAETLGSVAAPDPVSTQSAVAPEEDVTQSAVAPEEDVTQSAVAPEEDEKSRIVESVMEQASVHIEKEKEKKVSRFTDETIKEIVSDKAAKSGDKKKLRVEVVTLGSGIASAIIKGIDGVIDTGKRAATAAGSGAKAAVDIVGTGVKNVSEVVKDTVKPGKPPGGGAKVEINEKSVLSDSAKSATAVVEKVADGVLAVGSGVGKMTGYVARGAVAAPVDIIKGVSGVLIDTASRVARLFLGFKKKPGRKD